MAEKIAYFSTPSCQFAGKVNCRVHSRICFLGEEAQLGAAMCTHMASLIPRCAALRPGLPRKRVPLSSAAVGAPI